MMRDEARRSRTCCAELQGCATEVANWGLALLMRPAKATSAVPFANFAATPTPERLR